MKFKRYKTKYSSIVRKGTIGTCVDVVANNGVYALLIEFDNKEKFFFLKRDLEEIE